MRIALAGGTGFTGRRVAARLDSRGHTLACLVRSDSDRSVLPPGVSCTEGDLGHPASLDAWLGGADALVYVASMGFGHVPGVIDACRDARIERGVFVSTTALFTRLPAASKVVRTAAEDAVRESGLAWTIVRPTMIYGAPGDRNMERLLRAVTRWPVVPVPGLGASLVQPVHVDDLADGIAAALGAEEAIERAFDLSGSAPLSLDDTIRAAGAACGRRVRLLHAPLRPVVWTLSLCERLGLRLRVKAEQVLRLAEDKDFAHDDASRAFGFHPRTFEQGISEEARLLCLSPESSR